MYFSLCKNDLQWHLSTGQACVSAIVFACHIALQKQFIKSSPLWSKKRKVQKESDM